MPALGCLMMWLCKHMLCAKLGLEQSSDCLHKVWIRALHRQSSDFLVLAHPLWLILYKVLVLDEEFWRIPSTKSSQQKLPRGNIGLFSSYAVCVRDQSFNTQNVVSRTFLALLYFFLVRSQFLCSISPCTSMFSEVSCVKYIRDWQTTCL